MPLESPTLPGGGFPPADGPRFAPLVEGNEHGEPVGAGTGSLVWASVVVTCTLRCMLRGPV
jgi:hypothetical protein